MKIKEVVKRTGLTERTVRFYVEQGLIDPEPTVRNGRTYREYSERDVDELLTVADLRRLYFSIDEILEMKRHPENIPAVVEAYKKKVAEEARVKSAVTEALERLDLSKIPDIAALAARLRNVSSGLPLPQRDVHPDFGKFEPGTKEDRARAYEKFMERERKRYRLGQAIVFTIAALNVVFSLISAVLELRLFSLLIQIALSVALFMGVTWVRYLFVFGAALQIFLGLNLLANAGVMLSAGWTAFIVLQMIIAGVSGALLLFSSAVSDFLYTQKNG